MKRKDAFPSKWMSKEDVEPPKTFTIESLIKEDVQGDGGLEEKNIMRFEERDSKPLILNGTNWDLLEQMFRSDDSDDWIGKAIELYNDPTVRFGNKVTGGIRARAPQRTNGNLHDAPLTKAQAVTAWNAVAVEARQRNLLDVITVNRPTKDSTLEQIAAAVKEVQGYIESYDEANTEIA